MIIFIIAMTVLSNDNVILRNHTVVFTLLPLWLVMPILFIIFLKCAISFAIVLICPIWAMLLFYVLVCPIRAMLLFDVLVCPIWAMLLFDVLVCSHGIVEALKLEDELPGDAKHLFCAVSFRHLVEKLYNVRKIHLEHKGEKSVEKERVLRKKME